ncbi:hypothetical protein EG68_06868 [Paragonimus skrjabini miyazakii]|uniref:Uncharacterized protein n=1 Tax=Paragonimus skrjabini miyazakii TaxID=59628 RepID=A0A8S9YNA0_9TREM|nr:hypothetical protein EG68_06868 [Paragonimus skrjabini miyazakii]
MCNLFDVLKTPSKNEMINVTIHLRTISSSSCTRSFTATPANKHLQCWTVLLERSFFKELHNNFAKRP